MNLDLTNQIKTKMEEVLFAYLKLPEDLTKKGSRQGGYLTVKNADGEINSIYKIGIIEDKLKVAKYFNLSQEKPDRLCRLRKMGKRHYTSWDSRNPDSNEFGGAIFLNLNNGDDYYLSFSGLPELGDESCMLMLRIRMLAIQDIKKMRQIAALIIRKIYDKRELKEGKEIFVSLLKSFGIEL